MVFRYLTREKMSTVTASKVKVYTPEVERTSHGRKMVGKED